MGSATRSILSSDGNGEGKVGRGWVDTQRSPSDVGCCWIMGQYYGQGGWRPLCNEDSKKM